MITVKNAVVLIILPAVFIVSTLLANQIMWLPAVLMVTAVCTYILVQRQSDKRRAKWEIVAKRGVTDDELTEFIPTHYFRLVRRRGWRNVEIEIGSGLDLPDAEPIPVQILPNDNVEFFSHRTYGLLPITWCPVVFEYRNRVFYGEARFAIKHI